MRSDLRAQRMHEERKEDYMNTNNKNDETTISITWHIDDVLTQAENDGVNLTEKDAKTILKQIQKNHDANIGINWDVISQAIQQFKK